MAPKLTETFNDKAKITGTRQVYITPAHEPLKDDLNGGISPRSDGGTPLPPLVTPFPPAPAGEVSKPPEVTPPSDPVPEVIELRAFPVNNYRSNFVPIRSLVPSQ